MLIIGRLSKAKAIIELDLTLRVLKCGYQKGLETLVVHTLNHECSTSFDKGENLPLWN